MSYQIEKLLRLEARQNFLAGEGLQEKADKLEPKIRKCHEIIGRSKDLIDEYEKTYGLAFECD